MPESRLPVDVLRTLVIGLLLALVAMGWLAFALVDELRASLPGQSAAWWLEQAFVAVHGAACVGVLLRRREAWWPAFVLTCLYLLQLAGAWIIALLAGRYSLGVTLFLCLLLLWRLLAVAPWRPAPRIMEA